MSDAKPAPYPADSRAKGWRFELDMERIEQSDTWALAPADIRPWLLMLWVTAWKQTPCGSLADDDELIAVRIGMKPSLFHKHKAVLMRGWWKAADGRLYHDTVAARALEMLEVKEKGRQRKADYRKRKSAEEAGMSHGTPPDGRGIDPARDDTGTGTGTYISSVPTGTETVPPSPPDPPPPPAPPPPAPPPAAPAPKPRKVLSPDEQARSEVWKAALSVLEEGDCPASQCRTFMGKLVSDYGFPIVKEAVAAAVTAQPPDARGYLKATCQRLKGERNNHQENLELSNLGAATRFMSGD